MDLLHQLAEAAREGQAHRIQSLIAAGADPNGTVQGARDHGAFLDQVTPLMIAAGSPRSNVETVSTLLEFGAEATRVATGGMTATWFAAGGGTHYPLTPKNLADLEPDHDFRNWGGGDSARLQRLLDAGGNPNEEAENGRSLLSEACGIGDPERVALLIRKGASVVPTQGTKGALAPFAPYAVPLFLAAEAGSAEGVRLLLDAGFPADFVCDGENALHHASTAEVMALLWEVGVRPVEDRWGSDPVDEAFEEDRLDAAEFLLSRLDPNPARQEFLDRKLVSCSGVRMNPEAVRILLRHGANPRRAIPGYGSALHSACWQGDGNGGRRNPVVRDTLTLLIDSGADINLRDENHDTPLHEAAHGDWGSPTSVEILLTHGADVDPVNRQGQTPLSLAAEFGDPECVRLLLAAGADPQKARQNARRNLKTWESIVKKERRTGHLQPHQEQALEDAKAVAQLLDAT